jgi:hypothetical protein
MLNFAPAAAASGASYSGGAATGAFTSSAGSGASSAGLFANPVGLALAGGQLAFGIAGMIQQGKVREQQAYNQAYKTAYSNSINQFRVEQQNNQIAAAFGAKVDFVQNQIENNFAAAQASWVAEQMRLNEVYDTAAYKSQAMQKLLKEALGTQAAREVYGKSARRGALVSTLGAYGRSRAQLVDSLMSETTAAQMRMERTEEQKRAQDKLAIAQLSVLPAAATFTPTPMAAASGPGFGQTALQLAGLGMQAFQTGYGVTPSGGSFLGIQRA